MLSGEGRALLEVTINQQFNRLGAETPLPLIKNIMRKIFYILAGIAAFALMASCNKEAHPVVPSGEKVTATFTVQLPDGVATKAISDGMTAKELLFMAYDQNGNHLNLDHRK